MKKILIILIMALVAVSCQKEPVETVFAGLDTSNGVYIACEGNFMYGNGSLSFYNPGKKKINNHIFYARNNSPLGDVVQSLAFRDQTLFIVVNNSGRIYGVDPSTIEYRGVISGLVSPRYIHFVAPGKAYVTDLYAHHIAIVNPLTFETTGSIDIGNHTSEQMIQSGVYVFVTDWSSGNHVLVVDSSADQLIYEIEVPFQPKSMRMDMNGKIWVLCEGGPDSEGQNHNAAMCRIDPETFTIERIFRFGEGQFPSDLNISPGKDTLYYICKDVYKMPVDAGVLPQEEFITARNHLFYTLAVNPFNSEIYVSDAIDYTQNAVVYRYRHTGEPVDSFRVGINPSGYLFRNSEIP